MAGTTLGGYKARDKNTANDPDFYRKIGHLGGSAPHKGGKGFAANRELARIAGAVGGRISRRGKEKVTAEERERIKQAVYASA